MHNVVEQTTNHRMAPTYVYDRWMMDGEFFLLLAKVCGAMCCRPACKPVNEATSKSILGYQYDQLLSPCRCKVSPLHPLSLIITHTYQALNILIIAKVIKAVKLRHLISLACQLPCLHGAACLFRWPHIYLSARGHAWSGTCMHLHVKRICSSKWLVLPFRRRLWLQSYLGIFPAYHLV